MDSEHVEAIKRAQNPKGSLKHWQNLFAEADEKKHLQLEFALTPYFRLHRRIYIAMGGDERNIVNSFIQYLNEN